MRPSVAAGRTMVRARFIVHSDAEGAAKPRPYHRPPCGDQVGLTGLGQPRLSEGAQPYLKTERQNSKGNRKQDDCAPSRVAGGGWRVDTISGLRSRPSGTWFGYSGSGTGPATCNPGLPPATRNDLNQPLAHMSPWPRVTSSRLCRDAQCPANQRSASIAARQPMPAAVIA